MSKKMTVATAQFSAIAGEIPGITVTPQTNWVKHTCGGRSVYVANTPNVRAVHISGFEIQHPRAVSAASKGLINGNVKQVIEFDTIEPGYDGEPSLELLAREESILACFRLALSSLASLPPVVKPVRPPVVKASRPASPRASTPASETGLIDDDGTVSLPASVVASLAAARKEREDRRALVKERMQAKKLRDLLSTGEDAPYTPEELAEKQIAQDLPASPVRLFGADGKLIGE